MESSNIQDPASATGIMVKEGFDEIFENEIESWCYGLARYPGEISPELAHRVVREMMPVFKSSIDHNYPFNLIRTAERISKATRDAVEVKEIALSIVIQMPAPYEMDEESQYVFAQVVDQAEQAYGDVISLLEKRWRKARTVRV